MTNSIGNGRAELAPGDLLLRCLRGETLVPPGELEHLDAPAWQDLVDRAIACRVGPLLYYRLRQSGASARIPESAVAQLRLAWAKTTRWNARLFRDLSVVAEQCRVHSIPLI